MDTIEQLTETIELIPDTNDLITETIEELPKVLVFTCSYKRPHMLRQCMLGIRNQTYTNRTHSINMTLDLSMKKNFYDVLFDDLLDEKTVLKYGQNVNQHVNHLQAITNISDYASYDIFIKVDDDDVYKKDYVENVVAAFLSDPTIDIVSSKVWYQLNGYTMYKGIGESLGGNPPGSTYHMPSTFAFNRRTLDVTLAIPETELISISHDLIWRRAWTRAGLNHRGVSNEESFIWYIHGGNTTTRKMLLP